MQVSAVGLEPGPWGGLSLSDGSRVFGKRLVPWLELVANRKLERLGHADGRRGGGAFAD